MTILSVDDQPINLKLLRITLEEEGHIVFDAADGLDALTILSKHTVDLIISDILMPRMDGYRLCAEVRRDPKLQSIPFIFFTATYNSPADAKLGYDMGADKYLQKPAPARVILDTIADVMLQASQRRRTAQMSPNISQVMKQYNEQLILKLEEKNNELTATLASLSESEQRFRQVVENIGEVFWMTDIEKRTMIYISPGYEKIWGRTVASLYASPDNWLESIHSEDRDYIMQASMEQSTKAYDVEYRILRPDNTIRWIHDRAFSVNDTDGKTRRIVGVAADVTERRKAQQELSRRERELEEAQRIAQIGSWEADLAGKNALWSNEQFRLLGMEPQSQDLTFEDYLAMLHPEDREKLRSTAQKATQEGGEFTFEHRIIRKDGKTRWMHGRAETIKDAAGRPVRLRGTNQDITQQKEIEQQLRQSQKMEAIGQLSGGVAHDFNNLLTVIIGHIEILNRFDSDPEAKDSLTQIRHAAERAANLTRQLLLFARKQAMQMQNLDLNTAVASTIKMLTRILGEDIQLEFKPVNLELPIHADTGMLDQILMNLAINARDAMPNGGRLCIETSSAEFDAETAADFPQVRAGKFASISVSDTGIGIPADVLPKIFEPFFTTKDVDKGTGLGLATVFGITQQHGGWINAYSEVNNGAVFRIYLPLVTGNISAMTNAKPKPAPNRGTETILLVEDEPSIRTLLAKYLAQLGYAVISAADGAEAVRIFAEKSQSIQLVITDLVMPGGMSGTQLAGILKKQKADLPIIFSSGYNGENILHDIKLTEGVNFLAKPYNLATMAKVIRDRLDAQPG